MLISSALYLAGCTQQSQSKSSSANISEPDLSNLPAINFSLGEAQQASVSNSVFSVDSESAGTIIIKAALSKPSDSPVNFLFAYNSNNSTATNLNDFLLSTPNAADGAPTGSSDEIQFDPGETEKFITINIVNDQVYEGIETISFWIFNNPNGKLQSSVNLPLDSTGRFFFQVNINDDESIPVVHFAKIEVANIDLPLSSNIDVTEDQSVAITVSLPVSKSSFDLKVNFELFASELAVEGVDYGFPFSENRINPTDRTSEIIIPKDTGSVTFFLPIYPDLIPENPETLTLALLPGDNYTFDQNRINTISIVINDNGNSGIPLNDTGIENCYDDTNLPISCGQQDFPNQDGATIGGNGPRFFKFAIAQDASLGVSPVVTDPSADWNCVYDQNTGLLWEVPKASAGTYSWFNDNPTTNGGASGVETSTDGTQISSSNTTQDRMDVLNGKGLASSLCQVDNWRLPKLNELLSIMDFETPGPNNTFINADYFHIENISSSSYFWTSSPSAITRDYAWCVYFGKIIKDSVKLCHKVDNQLPAIMVTTIDIIPQ